MDTTIALALAVSIGLGILVGLQREWAGPHLAGIRTFTLITLLGTVLGLLAKDQAWLAPAGLLAVAAIVVGAYIVRSSEAGHTTGLTTAVAALLMYSAGMAVGVGKIEIGILVGGAVAVLLQWKQALHGIVERFGENDIRAIMQMVLIGLIVFPVLPNKSYGPYEVLNPAEIWLMVVLICGISLGSYLAYRFVGARAGTLLGAVLGGLISSTATTVSHARRSRKAKRAQAVPAVVIMAASTVVFIRVFIEIAIVAPGLLASLLPQLGVMASWMFVITGVLWWIARDEHDVSAPHPGDPLQLRAAMVFGLLYVAVLLGVAVAKQHLGDRALYGVAALSGLTDMDAITLSTAQLTKKGSIATDVGWRMIMIGAMSNIVFKAIVVAVLGNRRTLKIVATAFGLSLAGGALLLALWP